MGSAVLAQLYRASARRPAGRYLTAATVFQIKLQGAGSALSYSTTPILAKAALTGKAPPSTGSQAVHSLTSSPASQTPTATPRSQATPAILSTLNPPATTRPPALEVPIRLPGSSMPAHLYALGKSYLKFFRLGLKAIRVNYRHLRALRKPSVAGGCEPEDRAALLLRQRTRHDLVRLPLFGLVILLTGEFSPLVVFLFPKLTPYTCRVPGLVDRLRARREERRRAAWDGLLVQRGAAEARALTGRGSDRHLARVFGVGGRGWDRVGLGVPFMTWRVDRVLGQIVRDDFLIRAGGGVAGLVNDELVLACEARGRDVRGKTADELRDWLATWVQRSTTSDEEEGRKIAREMLMSRG